jgi:hypothetical protein
MKRKKKSFKTKGKLKYFWNESSKLYTQRNHEQIKFLECLLPFKDGYKMNMAKIPLNIEYE